MDQTEYNRKMAILSLTFSQRLKIAWGLTKPRLIPYLLFYLVIGLVLGIPYFVIILLSPEDSSTYLVMLFPLDLLLFYLGVGLYSSVLKHMDNKEQAFQLSTIFEPFKLWQKILPALLVICVAYAIISFLVEFLILLPVAGAFISLAILLFLTMLGASYALYIAENIGQPTENLLTTPAKLVFSSLGRWRGALGAYILTSIPSFIFLIIALVALLMANPYFLETLLYDNYDTSHDTPDIGLGAIAIFLFFILLTLISGSIAAVFSLFMFAIAYKQSMIDQEIRLLNPASQAPVYQTTPQPFNPGMSQASQEPNNPQAPQAPQGEQSEQGAPQETQQDGQSEQEAPQETQQGGQSGQGGQDDQNGDSSSEAQDPQNPEDPKNP